ncbi:hypothetical protein BV22DRAFT_1133661 [Leucogyrophana mollusca]|uniref:Uncharacterized protein n=1 Tax=Leucogyrophana mollusca TaxID=85980 RepID=A0ACB8B1I5_9AGAM|nr:hypothetical protein BV22DRAFT_1133661 [Leucogyrophana mollusca]
MLWDSAPSTSLLSLCSPSESHTFSLAAFEDRLAVLFPHLPSGVSSAPSVAFPFPFPADLVLPAPSQPPSSAAPPPPPVEVPTDTKGGGSKRIFTEAVCNYNAVDIQ